VGVISHIKRSILDQFVDYSPTKPFYSWSEARNEFYIVSELGTLIYRSDKAREISRFRNKWINRFDSICKNFENEKKITRELFRFYREIREESGVKYRANLRSRLRAKIGIF